MPNALCSYLRIVKKPVRNEKIINAIFWVEIH